MRRVALFLSVVTIGVGAWLIIAEHAKNNFCNGQDVTVGGYGMSSGCLNIVWYYFGGFILVVAGLMTLAFTLAMIRRRSRRPASASIDPGAHRLDNLASRYAHPRSTSPVTEVPAPSRDEPPGERQS